MDFETEAERQKRVLKNLEEETKGEKIKIEVEGQCTNKRTDRQMDGLGFL
jgi:hypothetical protein